MRADRSTGFDALRRALASVLEPQPLLAGHALLSQAVDAEVGRSSEDTAGDTSGDTAGAAPGGPGRSDDDSSLATSSADHEADRERLIALVELARGGDKDAFGMLYDHYHVSVYRFVYYRVGSVQLAEDLTGETFFRALRSMNGFRWQGRDFGAWLMTIARNLTTDHFKSGRTRLEQTTEDMSTLDTHTEGPESAVLAHLTNEALLTALRELPQDQQDCLVMRFLQGMTIAETADVLERSAGAVKQLQLRAVRGLAALLPDGVR